MSVYKPKKSPNWHYDFVVDGRRFHGTTGVATRRQAEAVERRKRAQAATGELDDSDIDSLDKAAGRWWIERGRHLTTAVDVERRIGICLRLIGPNTRLVDLTTSKISEAIEKRRGETYAKTADKPATKRLPERRAKRYPIANATVNADIVGILRRILKRAKKTWEVKGLPEIDWQSLILSEPAPAVRYYTAAQRQAWSDECDATARDALRLLLTYGMRFNEVFFPPTAFDPGTGAGDEGGDEPRLILQKRKGDVPHVIELRADDARMIAARAGRAVAAGLPSIWFEQEAPAPALARVTRGRKGTEAVLVPVTYYGLQSRLNSAAQRAGVDGGRVIHGARHHAGTEALRRSKSLKLAQALLGHKDINSTLRYAHALQGDLRALVESESRNSPGQAQGDAEEFVVPQVRRSRRPSSS